MQTYLHGGGTSPSWEELRPPKYWSASWVSWVWSTPPAAASTIRGPL